MKVKVSRIRHPLACFSGEISVEDERTPHAEEIKLAFDYYPVIDAQDSSNLTESAEQIDFSTNKPVISSNGSSHAGEDAVPRFVKYDPAN